MAQAPSHQEARDEGGDHHDHERESVSPGTHDQRHAEEFRVEGERHQRAEWLRGWDKATSEQPKEAPALVKVHPFDVEIPVNDGDYIFNTDVFERMERSGSQARKPYADD